MPAPRFDLNSLLDHLDEVRVFPDIAVRINEVIRRPGSGIREIADAVCMDPVLSGRLLKVANSPFYALPRPASSVERAVQIIGLHATRDLALALAMSSVGTGRSEDAGDVWIHSLYTAVAMRNMARYVRGLDRDEAFVAGLLHDLGVMLWLAVEEDVYLPIHRRFSTQGAMLVRAEKTIFGFDHGELGAACLRRWRLADGLIAAVATHHSACTPTSTSNKTLVALHLASDLVEPARSGGLDAAVPFAISHPLSGALRIPAVAWEIIVKSLLADGQTLHEVMRD